MLKTIVPEIHVSRAVLARRFYSTLGFFCVSSWRPDDSQDDPCYMAFVRDSLQLNVTSFHDGALGGCVYVYVDDVDALHAEFTRRGADGLVRV